MVVNQLCWPLLMVAVMASGGWAMGCPQGCACGNQQNLLTANCLTIPYNAGKVEALTLLPRDTRVELHDGQFSSARHLKYLTLKNSSIYFVHKKAFYGAKKIVEIDMSFNHIEELDPAVFQHLTNLTRLSLRGNPIHLVSEMPFLISNSLAHLDIGHCKIKTIPRGIFYELRHLKNLTLDGNYLKSIAYNSLPKRLIYLDLSNNRIENVPTEAISALTNVRFLRLSENPINCTCSLMNFQDWLSGKGIIFDDDVTCDSPSEYKGVSWSKVNENRLCLVEAKREEEHYSGHSFTKNKFYKGPYSHKYYYLDENIQSDQPGSAPDSQVEVFKENEETLAMSVMMRDEESTKGEEEIIGEGEKGIDDKNLVDDTDKEIKIEKVLSIKDANSNADIKSSGDETNDSVEEVTSPKSESAENNNLETPNKKNNNENLVEDNNEKLNQIENTSDSEINLDSTEAESINNTKEEVEANVLNQTQSSPLNENNPVEFKNLNEEEQDVDEFKKEGLLHPGSEYRVDQNSTSEESTVIPEETTEDEFSGQGPIIEEDAKENYEVTSDYQNITSTSEINNITADIVEEAEQTAEEEVVETVSPPVIVPNVFGSNENQQTTTEDYSKSIKTESKTEPIIIPTKGSETEQVNFEGTESHDNSHVTQENDQTPLSTEIPTSIDTNPKNDVEVTDTINVKSSDLNGLEHLHKENVKEMAGAEVVMFCVAILVICLILYSVYKCRSSKNRDSMRVTKDLESNRGTELQDMATLLPKSPEEKKNNLKYDEKAPSSETVQLLTEQNENETVHFTPNPEVKNKIEDKNSINNNTSNSPSKTPLIRSDKPVAITPATPIQRTKVKVGIIPDSIPRTPIFLQKTYNGTKNV